MTDMGQARAKAPHQHEDWQLEETERGTYCKACGEYTSYRYPEHEKLKPVQDKSQTIGEFIDWLESKGIALQQYSTEDGRYYPVMTPVQRLLAEFFEIDEARLEQEKRAMLDELRSQG